MITHGELSNEMNISPEKKEAALFEYLDECQEMLENFSKNLATIEKGDKRPEILAEIYRDMHTIKGSSQLFGFSQIGQLAHAMETCLDPIRKGTMTVSRDLVDTLYSGCDTIASLLQGIRESKNEPDLNKILTEILSRLVAVAESTITETDPPKKDKDLAPEIISKSVTHRNASPSPAIDKTLEMHDSLQKINKKEGVAVTSTNSNSTKHPGFELFDDPTPPSSGSVSTAPDIKELETKPKLESPAKSHSEDPQSETIRVHVTLLDSLMNSVGELVLIRNQILQHAKLKDEDTEFLKLSQRLNILTAELQNEVMKTRMQPIGNILSKFTRVVRDLGKELGKKIELELHGSETELDKTIIEAVKDPLTHIVRNSVDHGIESPEERKKSGKSEVGLVRLKAYHESGQVIIEVTDDGRGLDRDRLGSKAIQKGLITKEEFSKMTDREVQNLIFAPGFSTAASLSNISGRGVGMDVVKTNVERTGGVVDVSSSPGQETTIKIKIPLTLAIVHALIVQASGQRFAIPQTKLVELLRIDESKNSSEKLESLQGRLVLRLRGKILPIISLADVLRTKGPNEKIDQIGANLKSSEDGVYYIAILNADGLMFGMIVDAIDDSADIVVKGLPQFLKDISAFSGATIMGDGSVALTLDVTGISETAQLRSDLSDDRLPNSSQVRSSSRHHSEASDFLLIDVGAPGSYAIPLTVVSRIEEFDSSRFERSGEQKVVRYRDSLLPIFSLPEFLHLPFDKIKKPTKERTPVVVIKRGDRSYGIEVCEIQDIIEVNSNIDQSVKDRPGILGTVVAQNHVIVVVDILGMIDAVKGRLEVGASGTNTPPKDPALTKTLSTRSQHRILLVEDSPFFRNYVRQVLQEAGYLVDYACDGAQGFSVLESSPANTFSLVLSDIEMPLMDGYELARKVRSSKNLKSLPMIAITTRFSSKDIETGLNAGFTRYLEKLNADNLLFNLDEILCNKEKGMNHVVNG
ncbi:MAG: chemotaxis protein CheW [Proteobacteria bacterium]|nr:chemotaxis protein CheW [Pseudomonadota bacterium]